MSQEGGGRDPGPVALPARRALAALCAHWLVLPLDIAAAVDQLLAAAAHVEALLQSGRPLAAQLDDLAGCRARLTGAVGVRQRPAGNGEGSLFFGFVLERLLDDDTHPYLIQAALLGPRAAHRGLCEHMAADLRRLQQVVAGVHAAGCDLAGGATAAASLGPSWLSAPPIPTGEVADPLAEGWSGAGPQRRELAARFARAADWGALAHALGEFVHRFGLGAEQGCAAFRFESTGIGGQLRPLRDFAAFDLSWMEGNGERIAVLEANTRNLLDGFRAHNALIWGPRGCGKSSLIRGLVTRYWDRGLRAIEVPSSSYVALPHLFGRVRQRRESFVAVLDNIALDRHDPSARALASVLDGGLEAPPRNLVFYATSNYKDLVDREGERPQGPPPLQVDGAPAERRGGEAPARYDPQEFQRLDERRALDDRFALKVFLDLPTKSQYEQLVVAYARRAGVDTEESQLLAEFHVWRLRHNHDLVGGRTARDFVLARYPDCARRRADRPHGRGGGAL